MLSKSQAKTFFLIGTGLCTAAFVLLTVDTFQRIPAQTHSENLTPEVIRGKHLFERNNCMGCHTIMGEGAYYAPELTKVFERRGSVFIKAMLKDPAAMYPGERQMTNYNFSDEQINDLTAFLKWVGEMDLNGFPAKPDLMKTVAAVASGSTEQVMVNSVNRPAVFNQVCVACHSLDGQGGNIGPVLDTIGTTRDSEYLKKWLIDPVAVKADSKMPKLPLTSQEISELVAFLSQLKGGQ